MTRFSFSHAKACSNDTINPSLRLTIVTKIVARNPAMGPANPVSKSSSLFLGGLLRETTAPKVPKGGGPGIK